MASVEQKERFTEILSPLFEGTQGEGVTNERIIKALDEANFWEEAADSPEEAEVKKAIFTSVLTGAINN